MRKLEIPAQAICQEFPGFSRQDIQEQTRRMLQNLERGVNPFSGDPYDFWDVYRHTADDVEEVRQQMLKLCCDL